MTDYDIQGYDEEFHDHFDRNLATPGVVYAQYEAAYRYGFGVANQRRYRKRDWEEIESEVREHWEEQAEEPWDQVQEAVRHGWELGRKQ